MKDELWDLHLRRASVIINNFNEDRVDILDGMLYCESSGEEEDDDDSECEVYFLHKSRDYFGHEPDTLNVREREELGFPYSWILDVNESSEIEFNHMDEQLNSTIIIYENITNE